MTALCGSLRIVSETIAPSKSRRPRAIAPNAPTHPRMLVAVERRAEVVHLRKLGYPFRTIAQQLSISLDSAYECWHGAMREALADPEEVRELRLLESERLDSVQVAIWPKAMRGDVEAVRAVVRISERRSRLWGLDAPVKTELSATLTDGRLPMAEIDRVIAAYEADKAGKATVVNPGGKHGD